MKSAKLIAEAPDWIQYDLPAHLIGIALKGKFRGQSQKWFAFRFEGDESEIAINPPPGGHSAEFDSWEWVSYWYPLNQIIDFKRQVYQRMLKELSSLHSQKVAHFLNDDR